MSRVHLLFSRALRWRCPNCGGGPLFVSWFKLAESCPGCGLWLERDDGYFLGAMAINLVVGESIPLIAILVTWFLTQPNVPWQVMEYGGMLAAVALPLLFFPLSRTLWLALDLTFRPVETTEAGQSKNEGTKG
ncbi:MAG TPA: DUF983 domain-containing protein [Chloroflexota bacterium]|nr:DUF983 domain-containing protein [Chloroflexota bacterium]